MTTVVDWLNSNQGAVMAALTLTYVITTAVILLEQRRLRLAQYSPAVVVDLEVDAERKIVFFSVENIGLVAARAVRFDISPKFENPKNPELNLDVPFVRDGLQVLAPGRQIRTLIAIYGDLELDGLRHKVQVDYESADGRSFSDEFVLDFASLMDVKWSKPKGLHSIAEELERLRKRP